MLKCARIGLAAEIFYERLFEHIRFRMDSMKQRHRGSELHIIRRSKDLARNAPFQRIDDVRALRQACAENGMSEIGERFRFRDDRKRLRHRGMSEALNLRKNFPHPMAGFSAAPKLIASRFEIC